MTFPDSPRVIYKKNPLDQVICQLKFPSILRIDNETPVEFQESIRGEYPLYFEGKEFFSELPLELITQFPEDVIANFPKPTSTKMNYRFVSSDENWTINLTNNFIALTTKKYDRWENFREHLETPLKALMNIYNPVFFSRVGLRYIDVIKRSSLGIENSNWIELIQPYILGIFSSTELESSNIKSSISTEEITFNQNEEIVRVIHGVATSKNDNEQVYLIDCDFFVEKQMEFKDATEKLNEFNHYGRRLFRWCITEHLHNTMQPEHL